MPIRRLNVALVATVVAALVAVPFTTHAEARFRVYDSPVSAAATDVLKRTIPEFVHKFNLKFDSSLEKAVSSGSEPSLPNAASDYYHVVAKDGSVAVTANSGVALTHGAYQYIKQQLKGQVTWGVNTTGMQLNLSAVSWPDYNSGVVKSNAPVRYAWNTCTFSYTAAFWDEARWLKEIDWMALHGVNFPLAATGQEYIYMEMFQRYYNISLTELQEWFAGPAFLTWQRFGNIQKFAGPLSYEWINAQKDLNLFILKKMRALGMRPVLSCFPGHVPAAFQRKFPNAKITPSVGWNGFPQDMSYVPFLDPSDPLFKQLGTQFLTVQQEIFGTDNYYACDTFNEVDPTNSSLAYLTQSSKVVADSIAAVDPKGVWMIQAWTFKFDFWSYQRTQAYMAGVPIGKLIILDLESMIEILAPRFDFYFGHFWVFNLLHNFGGNRAVYGPLTTLGSTTAGPYAYLPSANKGGTNGNRMSGIGFTPEAIEQNPAVYEMLTDTFFQPAFDGTQWILDYINQRYQLDSPNLAGGSAVKAQVEKAWMQMRDSVYSSTAEPRTELEWTPFWWKDQFGWQNGDPDGFYQAFLSLLKAAEMSESAAASGKFTLLNQPPFQYDLVDVSRQGTTMFWSDAHRMWASGVQITQNFAGTRYHERALNVAEAQRDADSVGESEGALKTLTSEMTKFKKNLPKFAHYRASRQHRGGSRKKATASSNNNKNTIARAAFMPQQERLSDAAVAATQQSVIDMGDYLISLIDQLDHLLGTNPNYLLGDFTTSATNYAMKHNLPDLNNTLYNAKNQVTLWGPFPGGDIIDYACKGWSGLYSSFYQRRWEILVKAVNNAVLTKTSFDYGGYTNSINNFETAWVTNTSQTFSPEPTFATPAQQASGSEVLKYSQHLRDLTLGANSSASFAFYATAYITGGQMAAWAPLWGGNADHATMLCTMMSPCVAVAPAGNGNLHATSVLMGSSVSVSPTYVAGSSYYANVFVKKSALQGEHH